ncbi:MAG: molybdenum ABC transporter ATP-binding protein [Rhizobiales bacterium]|nr:molybdenum ABC transporter ATP-binding protein [Hyphomicrobiales bacterium]
MAEIDFDTRIAFGEFVLDVSDRMALDGITALFGPSGCGKSTLLRIISGLEPAARGRVRFGDEVWQDDSSGTFVPAHRRGVGYVFQDVRLFPHLTVAGNLRYADKRSQLAGSQISLDGVVRALDLAPLMDRRTPSLSGGERQRVAIGRTLLTRPRLLLMDEPLAALDVRRKREILPLIEGLPKAFGVPVIYVTHAIDEVARLAQRMLALASGRKVAEGPVADVLARLDLQSVTGRFEAGVVLTARVTGHDRHFRLTHLDHHGQDIVMPMAELAVGDEVRLRIRARDVALATKRPEEISVRNIMVGSIAEIVEEPETAFAETLVDVGGAKIRARVTRSAVAELALAPGKPVFALIKSIAFDRRALSLTAPSQQSPKAADLEADGQ